MEENKSIHINKGGRPKKSNIRNNRLTLMLSEDEFEIIKKASEVSNTKIGIIARKMLLKSSIVSIEALTEDEKKALRDFNLMGNNLNQIAKGFNESGKIDESEIVEIKKVVKKIIEFFENTYYAHSNAKKF
ncbi:MAG: plasmid mobilization relaxosome protein MobC [Sphingobacteriaceae bacterium]|nr:plasmid mobilization relaxosome protein MobC [Sphingobacteriaceae bacterium]